MKGYIFLFTPSYPTSINHYFITIETNELIPISTRVVNEKHATYTSERFKVEKIIRVNKRLRPHSQKQIEGHVNGMVTGGKTPPFHFKFEVGKEIIPYAQIHIYKTLKHLRYLYLHEMRHENADGCYKQFNLNGETHDYNLIRNNNTIKSKFLLYPHQCISYNYLKNTTTLKSAGDLYHFPFIANFYCHQGHFVPHSIRSICYYRHGGSVFTKDYIDTSLNKKILKYKCSKKSITKKKHGIEFEYYEEDTPYLYLYKFDCLLPTKNLQILRKSPWNPMGDINKISVF
jgi:hypothetical protein